MSIQWHAGLAEGVWLGAGSQLRQHPNGLGQGRRHIYRTEPTGMTLHRCRRHMFFFVDYTRHMAESVLITSFTLHFI